MEASSMKRSVNYVNDGSGVYEGASSVAGKVF